MMKKNKGFTLIELLIVIAIVAVLAVVVILTLNPAELLKQARDSNRVSDMATMKSALALYLADVGTPWIGTSTLCYTSNSSASAANCGGLFSARTVTPSNSRAVDASGWIPVNFNAISSGSPLGQLPVDPTNNATYYYAYRPVSATLVYELDASAMESLKYSTGTANVTYTDGGNNNTAYEVGTSPGLAL